MKYTKLFIAIPYLLLAIYFIFNCSSIIPKSNTDKEIEQKQVAKNYNISALKLPETVSFAGEMAPLNRWYVKEAFDRELLVNTYWQSQTLLLIKRANRFLPFISDILKKEGLPDDLKYIAVIESGLVPTIVSPAGAVGIWQFMKSTGKEFGLEINDEIDERYHLKKATLAACKYLKKAKNDFGNWTLAAAAYNAGYRGIQNQMQRQDASNYYDLLLNPETGRYVYRILAIKTILENPKQFGFNFDTEDLYNPIPTDLISVNNSIEDLAKWAKKEGINYPILKEFNPWLRQNYLKNKYNKTYEIEIPKKEWRDFNYSNYNDTAN